MGEAIRTDSLSHMFGTKQVLDELNFQVDQGEIFGLLGPSGAGKTTLINILTGQLRASSGESYIFGVQSTMMTGEDYKQVGIMMDRFGLYERMSCYDNLKFYQMLDGNKESDIDQILKEVGLLEAKKTQVINLSTGMTNRLAFARAILRRPRLLFLDEPTSGLDPTTVDEIHKMILQEKEQGTTVLLTTHNMFEAEKLCDNILLLDNGKIVEYGNPTDICRRYNDQKEIRIHLKNGEDIILKHTSTSGKQIMTYLEQDEIDSIHSTEPNLEMIFMKLTGRKLEV